MLVCNVSLRPPHRAIAADITEAAAALDATTTGFVVFAALVDDPASVLDIVDGYIGEIMLEAASAADAADAGLAYAAIINEATTATDTPNASVISLANTWNPSDLAQMTLSGSNLTATSTGTTAGVRHTTGHSSGKYYWEATTINWGSTGTEIGLATSSASLQGGGIAGQAVMTKSVGGFNGSIYINGTYSGSTIAAGVISNNIIGIAVDLTAGLIWFRNTPAGNWNGSSTANPATGAGGISLGALAGSTLLPLFAALATSEDVTANFGGSAFNGAVPSGFTAGW
jgi:hypothetical protein